MNFTFDFKEYLNKKIALQIYFILFILLNIVDFLNLLEGDLDFFKKLLSWTIIGYIFYKVSLTKIFIGKTIRSYDLAYIFAFCLMIIPRTLTYYIELIGKNFESFHVFGTFLEIINGLQGSNYLFQNIPLVIGFLLIIFISIRLISKYKYEEESFLGSFNFSDYFKFIKLDIFLLIIISLFFGIFIFNMFMEWFALAVDAIILVLGLFYYLFKYLHNHTNNKFTEYLQITSNTGNEFYSNLILAFSNKKTFLIGISFLLTLHLMVDTGVYLVPYTLGTENGLYFGQLGDNHNPFFLAFLIVHHN